MAGERLSTLLPRVPVPWDWLSWLTQIPPNPPSKNDLIHASTLQLHDASSENGVCINSCIPRRVELLPLNAMG
ncbi:hypothetical protein EYZ11_009397 [Aspergillus tanneri]|uniref:Uncharacterized protein n=1 Tax=Aspergillus tanneri TaxID=1220188 RepID=A0A4S3JA59_9EURO|nr:hypothetical protein EYZ11_009397 [Aspergillus tanneri]